MKKTRNKKQHSNTKEKALSSLKLQELVKLCKEKNDFNKVIKAYSLGYGRGLKYGLNTK